MLLRTLLPPMTAVLLAGCAGGTPDTTDVCENFEVAFATLDRFQQPVSSFGTTEVVRFQHTVRNKSNQQQTVNGTYPSSGTPEPNSCLSSVGVSNAAGNDVYSDPRGAQFSCAAVANPFQLVFAAGETKSYIDDWNQPKNGASRTDLTAGNYTGSYKSYLGKCAATFDKKLSFTLR